ncbi:DUF4384 domain-containing protein [uncultured Bacteroides sp.]|uniref:DUF4384 domain-containing protein n=1 Tax=uncultured Bacteroides sp. TaxID=162156 RepID=UPI0025EB2A9F|nr:DUF4384 domain-containing protein [uncultured Bacteroides sp.]
MNWNNQIKWIFLLLILIVVPLHAQNTVKVKGVQGRWQVSDNVTLKEAEEHARMEAKKEALRKAGVMENVWSVFGQITQENGTEFQEAYSQMNVLAIGGMVNVTKETVEEVWDTNNRSLYKVVTIDATVQKEEKVDKSYALEVKGISTLYKEGDVFTCTLKVHGTDSYLKFFWFDSNGGALLYPNEYEGNTLLKTEHEYKIPFSNAVDYRMEKQGKESEKINMMMVATKENIPYTDEVSYQNVLKWVYSIPNDKRCAFYDMILIK